MTTRTIKTGDNQPDELCQLVNMLKNDLNHISNDFYDLACEHLDDPRDFAFFNRYIQLIDLTHFLCENIDKFYSEHLGL